LNDIEEDPFEQAISLLRTAQALHLQMESPITLPAEVLLDLMIDAALQLRQEFQEGLAYWQDRSNPTLEFCERPLKILTPPTLTFKGRWRNSGIWETLPDQLGNVAQKRTYKRREHTSNPKLVNFFTQLAELLVKMKHDHQLPKDLYSKEEQPRRHPTSKISPETFWYLKRRKDHPRSVNTRQQ